MRTFLVPFFFSVLSTINTVYVSSVGKDNSSCGGSSSNTCLSIYYAYNNRVDAGGTIFLAANDKFAQNTILVTTFSLSLVGSLNTIIESNLPVIYVESSLKTSLIYLNNNSLDCSKICFVYTSASTEHRFFNVTTEYSILRINNCFFSSNTIAKISNCVIYKHLGIVAISNSSFHNISLGNFSLFIYSNGDTGRYASFLNCNFTSIKTSNTSYPTCISTSLHDDQTFNISISGCMFELLNTTNASSKCSVIQVYHKNSTLMITKCNFSRISSSTVIYLTGSLPYLTFSYNSFVSCSSLAGDGGALALYYTSLFTNSNYNTILACNFSQCISVRGGAILIEREGFYIKNCNFFDNSASYAGSDVFVSSSSLQSFYANSNSVTNSCSNSTAPTFLVTINIDRSDILDCSTKPPKTKTGWKLVLEIGLPILLVGIVVVVCVCWCKYRKNKGYETIPKAEAVPGYFVPSG